jgi:hypothetical protein
LKKTEDDSGTEHYGGKNDKRTNNPIPESLYAESNAVAIKAIYYGINMIKDKYQEKPKRLIKGNPDFL